MKLKYSLQAVRSVMVLSAWAISAFPALAEQTTEVAQLDAIKVTADKTEKNKQEVDISVTTYDETMLQDYDINSVEDLANESPNVSFYRADNQTTYLVYRGIGGTTNMNKVYNINTDGVTMPYVGSRLLDTERVEVIRGSQGALYGRNTYAGVVNVITRDPGDETNADIKLDYGSYNTLNADLAVGGPINEDFGARLALGYTKTDGYFENTFQDDKKANHNEQISGRLKLVYEPTQKDKLSFSLTADQFDGGFDSYVAGGGYKTENNESGYNDGSLISPTLTWTRQMDQNIEMTSITNYARSNYGFLHDWDFTSYDIATGEFDEVTTSLSQELRFNGKHGGLDWLAGAFLMTETLDTETTAAFGQDAAFWMMPVGAEMKQESTIDTQAAAVFGQAIYRFEAPFELSARLRVDYEQKKLDWTGSNNMMPGDTKKDFDESWTGTSPSLAFAWLMDKQQRVYLSYATGYKAGDYNNVQVDPQVVTEPVDPEYSTTYELGYKGLFAGNRVEFNAAAFYIDWRDLQVETPINNGSTPIYVKQNAAEAHSQGVEMEFRARPLRGWDVFAGAGYLFEYEFDKFPNSTSGDLSGKKLPSANEFNVSLGTTYRTGNGLFGSVNAMMNGPKFFDEANQFEQKTYTIVNAKIGYEWREFSAYVYGRNLLDEDYTVSMFSSAEMSGEPQVYGVQVSYVY